MEGDKGMIWFEPSNLQGSLVSSHFDGTKLDVITRI